MKKLSKKLLAVLLVIVMLVPTGVMCITSSATDVSYNVGDIVELGSYPQTRVTDSALISSLNSISATWNSYGYMSGSGSGWCDGSAKESDYMKYKDVTYNNERYRAIEFSTYRPGFATYKSTETCFNYQKSNGYLINNVYWFKFESLKWRILDPDKGLLLCESIIDSQSFNNNLYSTGNTSTWSARYWKDSARTILANNYEKSDIKEWLNNDFYYTAFTGSYENLINSQTNGKIILLTKNDTTNTAYGFTSDTSRIAYGTDYAKAQGLMVANGASIWITQTAASFLGINICGVYFDGHTFDRESNNYGHTQMTFHGIRPAIYIDLAEFAEYQSAEQYPDGYDPDLDKYGFTNLDYSIERNVYTDVYGTVKGWWLHSTKEKNGAHGVCYGMAGTTAALLQNKQLISTFSDDVVTAETLSRIQNHRISTLYSPVFNATVQEYIKYAHIYQFDSESIDNRDATKNDLEGLYNAVKDYVSGEGEDVVITVAFNKSNKYMHALYAVGIREDIDEITILIDDSNFFDLKELKISRDFSSWQYCVPDESLSNDTDYNYNSENSWISYESIGDKIYNMGLKLGGQSVFEFTHFSQYHLLVNSSSRLESNVAFVEIYGTYDSTTGAENTQSSNSSLYWLEDNVTNVTLTPEDNSEITVSDVNSSVTATINAGANAQFNVDDDGTNSVAFESKANDNAVITFVNADENGTLITTTITGTASGDEVTATETDNGIQVAGLNNITVTYETADGTDTVTANITDGRTMNIVADDASNSVAFDWNCSHLCHSTNSFMQFIWKIAKFICRIFGTNQYCDCGMAHW